MVKSMRGLKILHASTSIRVLVGVGGTDLLVLRVQEEHLEPNDFSGNMNLGAAERS